MIRYTVTYTRDANSDLAREWLSGPDRAKIAEASNEIDRQLARDTPLKGEEVHEGLRRLVAPPLIVLFTVEEQDRIVTVWSFRRVVGEQE